MPNPLPPMEQECFVMSPIGAADSPERERANGVLDYVIRPAADSVGLKAVRVDRVSEPGSISAQVLDHVLHARVAVADLTGSNPNVFYELGVRHAFRLPVVLICEGPDGPLPFDLSHERTIFFDSTNLNSAGQAKSEIERQLRSIDQRPPDSPVATAAALAQLGAGDATEKMVARLADAVESLNHRIDHALLPRSLYWPPSPWGSSRRPSGTTDFYGRVRDLARLGEPDVDMDELRNRALAERFSATAIELADMPDDERTRLLSALPKREQESLRQLLRATGAAGPSEGEPA